MAGLVQEIQMDALDPKARVSDLLRKVKVAAVKLDLGKVESWVESELNGYTGDVPSYRILYGRPRAFNPYNGWLPIIMETDRDNTLISRVPLMQSLPSIEDTLEQDDTSGHLEVPFSPRLIQELNRTADVQLGRMANHLSYAQVGNIVHQVRNMILDWALALEKAGVTGEGFTFSAEERGRAKGNPVTYNIGSIGTFAGNLGEGNASGSITATQTATVSSTFGELAAAITSQVPDATKRQELVAAVADMEKASPDRSAFAKAYGRFMSAAADHMTVVTPFLPALAAYLA